MRIELSWKDDDAILDNMEDAAKAWNDEVDYVRIVRDDGTGVYVSIDEPIPFDRLMEAFDVPDWFDHMEVDASYILHPEEYEEDDE